MSAFVQLISILATCTAVALNLSPIGSIIRIHRQRDTGLVSFVPLFALLVANHIWSLYGIVKLCVFPILVTGVSGDIATLGFLAVYYRWCPHKRAFLKAGAIATAIMSVITVYAVVGKTTSLLPQSLASIQVTVGTLAIASSIFLYLSPLETAAMVIRTRDSSSIPFALVSIGCINNVLSTIYSLLVGDMVLLVPSCINAALATVQIVLYFVFHPKRRSTRAADKRAASTASQHMQQLGTSISVLVDVSRHGAFDVESSMQSFADDEESCSAQSDLSTIKIDDTDQEQYLELRSPASTAHMTAAHIPTGVA